MKLLLVSLLALLVCQRLHEELVVVNTLLVWKGNGVLFFVIFSHPARSFTATEKMHDSRQDIVKSVSFLCARYLFQESFVPCD